MKLHSFFPSTSPEEIEDLLMEELDNFIVRTAETCIESRGTFFSPADLRKRAQSIASSLRDEARSFLRARDTRSRPDAVLEDAKNALLRRAGLPEAKLKANSYRVRFSTALKQVYATEQSPSQENAIRDLEE